MAENSKIEWTTNTFNPWIGCTNVSPGCDHCYAENMNQFRQWVEWGPHGKRRRTSDAAWAKPRQWNANAERFEKEHGHRIRVFCASLADVFDNKAPHEWRLDLFALIRATPRLDWQLLTKRPQNIARFLPNDWQAGYPNVWLGVTAEDSQHYAQRWPILAEIPAAVRFISYEPAIGPLGPIDLGNPNGPVPDWIISGGESGPGARVMQPEWARLCRDECERHGVAFFHKQWGTYRSNPLVIESGKSTAEAKVIDSHGKGGVILDGRVWRDFPATPNLGA